MKGQDTGFRSYLSVKDGKIRESATEDTPGAKLRSGKLKDGSTFEKWELVYKYLSGFITAIEYDDSGKFGARWNISMQDGDENYVLQLTANARETADFLQRLPNVDFTQPVKLVPYKFKDSGSAGIVIYQGDDKLGNYFIEKVGDLINPLHGYPVSEPGVKGDEFKLYAMQRDIFLKKYIIGNVIPKVTGDVPLPSAEGVVDTTDDDEDLPF